jgi:SanA protein
MVNILLKRKFILITISIIVLLFILTPKLVAIKMKKFIFSSPTKLPNSYTCLILGAKVYKSGYPSVMLADRLKKGVELYKKGKVKRFLLSGDHGQKKYDEVNSMRKFLQKQGIPGNDIFLDHAGFNTYNSVARAKHIFEVSDVIIVTQKYHLSRAIFLARSLGLNAFGCVADKNIYPKMRKYKRREYLASFKAIFEAIFHPQPKYLGSIIPITGSSKLSWD